MPEKNQRRNRNKVELTWPSATGQTYRIETSTTLQTWTLLQGGLTTNFVSIHASEISAETRRYYRVVAEQ